MSLLVRGARAVLDDREQEVDIRCENGVITDVGPAGHASTVPTGDVIDAEGLLLLPGIIDPHVHCRDPGQTQKEDLEHATRAAAAGGITTILQMPNTIPPVSDGTLLSLRAKRDVRQAYVDFGLWGLALNGESAGSIGTLKDAGAVAVKVFWGFAFDRATHRLVYDPTGVSPDSLVPPATTGELWAILEAAAKADLLVGLHCEDRGILDILAPRFGSFEDYESLLAAHPIAAETTAIASAIEIARGTGARIHILHISSSRGVDLVQRAQADGLPVTGETCPHYLTFTAEDFASIGGAMKVYPPIRGAPERDALWRAVNAGVISSIGSDHAPHTAEEKLEPLAIAPAGVVAIQTMLPVLLNEVAEGRTTLATLVRVLSTNTARLYGLFPRKGSLSVGADADLTLVDLEAPWKVDDADLLSKTKLTPWHGRHGRGKPVTTIVRGRVVMREGEVLGPPRGRPVWPSGARLRS